jgi:hypothetical protein
LHAPARPARRQQLGIRLVGDPAIQHLINVHFYSEQLAALLAARPAMLHFVFSSQAIVVMVTHSMARGEFVAQVRLQAMLCTGRCQLLLCKPHLMRVRMALDPHRASPSPSALPPSPTRRRSPTSRRCSRSRTLRPTCARA